MKIIARVDKLLELQSGTTKAGKQWKKQSVLVTQTGTAFKDVVLIDFWNQNIIDLNEGENYNFEIVIKSREYNGKYYTNVNCNYVGKVMEGNADDKPF